MYIYIYIYTYIYIYIHTYGLHTYHGSIYWNLCKIAAVEAETNDIYFLAPRNVPPRLRV